MFKCCESINLKYKAYSIAIKRDDRMKRRKEAFRCTQNEEKKEVEVFSEIRYNSNWWKKNKLFHNTEYSKQEEDKKKENAPSKKSDR